MPEEITFTKDELKEAMRNMEETIGTTTDTIRYCKELLDKAGWVMIEECIFDVD